MKLVIELNGKEEPFEMERRGSDTRFRFGAGPERRADVEQPEPGVYSVLMDGRNYEARVEVNPGGMVVIIDGERFEVEVHDPRQFRRRDGQRGAEGLQRVLAPMPGKVVRVLVKAGDEVAAGQGLMVMEAMKMQNEMRAPQAGRVVSVPVAEGATVAAGDVLATLE